MNGPARLALTLSIALAAWGLGRVTAPEPAPPEPEVQVRVAPEPTTPEWRIALEALRGTAGADALRERSYEVLNTAEADLALADAIELLGWTGTEADAQWLASIASSRDPALEDAAIQALGRLGSDAAVEALLQLDRDPAMTGMVLDALGRTGNDRAYEVLVERLDHPQQAGGAARALARFGTPAAAFHVGEALHTARPVEIPGMALALAQFPGDEPRQILYDELNAASRFRRDAALSALAQVRDPMVYDLLIRDLQTGTTRRKAQAAWNLGTLQDPRATHALHQAALTGSRELQSAAVNALAQIDTRRSRAILLELIDAGPEPVANQAVWTLKDPEAPDAVEALAGAWRRRSWNVRSAITHRLFNAPWMRTEVPEAVLELARAELADLPPGGNTQAPAFLLEHGTTQDVAEVERLLADGPTQARMRVVQALGEWPGPAADRLLVACLEDRDPSVRESAVRALLQRGLPPEELEDPLLAQLESGGMNGRIEQLLVELGTPRALQAVEARVGSGTLREQNAAIQALAWSGEASSIEVLRGAATGQADPDQRRQIYQALLWSPSGLDDELVDTLMNDDDPSIRAMGVQALSQRGPESREPLVELSRDDDPQVRMQALSVLSNVGGTEAEARLIEALDDPELGSTALSGLSQLGSAEARRAVREAAAGHADPSVRSSAIHQLAWSGGGAEAQQILDQALDGDEPMVRQAALSALENLGTSSAAESLVRALDDADDSVAQQAAYALQRLGGPLAKEHVDAIEALVQPQDSGLDFDGGLYVDGEW